MTQGVVKKNRLNFRDIFLFTFEIILLFLAFFAAYFLRHYTDFPETLPWYLAIFEKDKLPFFTYYLKASCVYVFISMIFLIHFGLYRRRFYMSILDEIVGIIKASFVSNITLAALAFFYREFSFSRLTYIYLFFTSIIFLSIFRTIRRSIIRYLRKKGVDVKKVLIYGAGDAGKMLKHHIEFHTEFGFNLIGFIDDDPDKLGQKIENLSVLGTGEDLHNILKKHDVDLIIIAMPTASRKKMFRIISQCKESKTKFFIMPDLFDFITSKVYINRIGTVPVLEIIEEPLSPMALKIKRTFDFTLSLLGLIILSPLFLLIAVLIKLESEGPIIFKQKRVGKNGKVFDFYKFRSMYKDAEKRQKELEKFNITGGPTFKIPDDPRITKVGKLLRKFSLDELPQLYNVLKGDMSLVGPRPPIPSEVEKYEPWHMQRLSVTPGISGLWQVSGRSKLSFDQMVRLDIYYIENWSLWLDIKILLKTIPIVLFGSGAY